MVTARITVSMFFYHTRSHFFSVTNSLLDKMYVLRLIIDSVTLLERLIVALIIRTNTVQRTEQKHSICMLPSIRRTRLRYSLLYDIFLRNEHCKIVCQRHSEMQILFSRFNIKITIIINVIIRSQELMKIIFFFFYIKRTSHVFRQLIVCTINNTRSIYFGRL